MRVIFPLFFALSAAQQYMVDLAAGGLPFAGVGAQSTAGSARLLIDYPEPQRSQVLDFLFKPQFGASLQHLKVEIGGDAQISCGAEASGQRAANASADWRVGYEGWLLSEAKARNPDLALLGLVYAWPSWISPGNESPWASPATEANAADYMVNWVRGMRAAYNLSIDWVGLWNEREYTVSYVTTLRGALDDAGFTGTKIVASDRYWDPAAKDFMGSPAMRAATAALTQHYPNCDASGRGSQCSATFPNAVAAHAEFGVPLYSTEDYSCWTDDNSAVHWVAKLNNNYLGGNITFFSAWYLLTSFYPTVAFWNDGLLRATVPWGGHYELSPTLWATAHYTQFTQPAGWRYLLQGRGSGTLAGGGTYVSLVDAVGNFTMVIEAAGAEGSLNAWSSDNCNAADGLHYEPAPAPQNATFSLRGAAVPQALALWRSRFQRGARTAPAVFERLPDVAVGAGGAVSLVVEPDTVYTLSTFPGATKGVPPSGIPSAKPFPLPYSDDFEALPPGRPGRYWSDMHGGFQVAPAVAGGGQVLRQAVPAPACCNFIQSLGGPLGVTILGDASWRDVEVAVDMRVPSGFALVGVRAQFVRGFFQGGLATPGGAFLAVSPTSWCWVLDVAALCGAKQGAGCAAWAPAACALQGALPTPAPGKNSTRVAVGARGGWAWATIDGAPLSGLANFSLPHGSAAYAGAGFVALGATFSAAAVDFDNVAVAATAPPAPAPGVGSVLRGMPCGDAAADVGARWALSPGGAGVNSSLALAGAPSLCLAPAATAGGAPALAPCDPAAPDQLWAAADASVVHAVSGLCLGAGGGYPGAMTPAALVPCGGRARRLYWSPDTGYLHTAAQAPLDMVCLGAWVPPPPPPPPPPPQAAAFAAAGKGVAVPAGGANASWDSGACNHVALLSAPSNPTFWLHVVAGAGYIDIGFCAPDIDLNINGPTDWMGYAVGKAWVYRSAGAYQTAAPPPGQGVPYGTAYGAGDFVAAARRSGTELEFFVNNASQGVIKLPPPGIPDNVLGCAGVCLPNDGVTLSAVA